MNDKHTPRTHLYLLFACIVLAPMLFGACSHLHDTLWEANDQFKRGNYNASLSRYEQIIAKHPEAADRVLFEMGIIYAYPHNTEKDYQKSLACFQKILQSYPDSTYRHDSAQMISHINNGILKEKKVVDQQTRIAALEREIGNREQEILTLQKKIATLERELKDRAFTGPASRILIEKSARRLTLFSKDNLTRSYRIALGGNPTGPKERIGDKKTPEGTYIIDARNKDSRYHLALHISYPNEKDKQRARALGVSPGGNIMIHGLKNGFSWVGDFHRKVDWTEGCIAVTNEEIEEIARLVPDGTIVEIRP